MRYIISITISNYNTFDHIYDHNFTLIKKEIPFLFIIRIDGTIEIVTLRLTYIYALKYSCLKAHV